MGPRAGLDTAVKRKVDSHGPPKRWFPTTQLRGVITQKTATSGYRARINHEKYNFYIFWY